MTLSWKEVKGECEIASNFWQHFPIWVAPHKFSEGEKVPWSHLKQCHQYVILSSTSNPCKVISRNNFLNALVLEGTLLNNAWLSPVGTVYLEDIFLFVIIFLLFLIATRKPRVHTVADFWQMNRTLWYASKG